MPATQLTVYVQILKLTAGGHKRLEY
ncbi:uncharacterized protein METZ01_LOCUS60757 [marine metagenome]|uniref:Uncharacterized protein n=1 Tax=marine metagenome TaxID=408172 RepID=A0A381T2K9_9ZZZZ